GQPGVVVTVGSACRQPGQGTNLLEGESAPEPGDQHFPLFQGQRPQGSRGRLGVKAVALGGDEPGGGGGGGAGLMVPPTALGSQGTEGRIANHSVEPGHDLVWERTLGGELDECFLDDVLG